jgi:predicted permease
MLNLKLAFRSLAKSPVVTVVAVVSLALGIGANVAIFSLFNRILLRPLPVQDPGRLVNLSSPGPKQGSTAANIAGGRDAVFSYPLFRDLEKIRTVFAGVAAHRSFSANLASRGQTLSGAGMFVSGGYFSLLGLQPALGRLLGPDDVATVNGSPVVVVSYDYWTSRFAGRPDVLGQPLIVNGQALTIVGVAPAEFQGTSLGVEPEVFVPITMRGVLSPGNPGFDNRRAYWAYLFARLKPGVSLEQARVAMAAPYRAIINDVEAPLQRGMSDQVMKEFRLKPLEIEEGARGQSTVAREAGVPVLLLLGVTGLVLLIACANIANLLLARGAARASEMAVRLATGASRRQVVAQLLTESFVLAALGGLAGALVTQAILEAAYAILPPDATVVIPRSIDWTALAFAAAVTLATGVLFGLFPALHSSRPDLVTTLKGQSGQATGSVSAARFRTTLATTQIALAMTLLVVAGLFIKSLVNVSRTDLGLKTDHVVAFTVSPILNGYSSERSLALFESLERELAAVPGVTSVGAAIIPVLSGSTWGRSVSVEGFEPGPDGNTSPSCNDVGPGYFKTLGVPLLAGREFTPTDHAAAARVAIVNEAFAKRHNLGRIAVGKHLGLGGDNLDIEIVGMVADAKYGGVKEAAPAMLFIPYRQEREQAVQGSLTFYVRAALDPEHVVAAVPKVVARLDPNLPVEELRTMPQQVRQNVYLDLFVTTLASTFAGLATLLAAIGLYGVLAYTLAQRTRELGLRMALGASPSDVRRVVLMQVARMAVVGGVVGLAAAIAVGRAAQSLLFEMSGYDAMALTGAIGALLVVVFAAGFIPAQRAAHIQPMRAMRYE